MTNLHLSMTKKRYKRGDVVCKEGDPSDYLFIVCKGEFEVSKVVDMSKVNQLPDFETKGKKIQHLPKRKLDQMQGNQKIQGKFGHGIQSTKIEYSNKEAAFSDFKRIRIALIGEGRIHGEDDIIAERVY